MYLQSPFRMFVFCEKGAGQYRQGAGNMLPICVGIKKLIDGTSLLKCEPSGNRIFSKVDDGFQSPAAYNVQQTYRLLKCSLKSRYDAIFLRESNLVRFLIALQLLQQPIVT